MFTTFIFAILLIFFSQGGEGKSLFDGTWKLDHDHFIGDRASILSLSGMSGFKIKIVLGLQVTETYNITGDKTLKFTRSTKYTSSVNEFTFGQTQEVSDDIFGNVKETVLYGGNGRRLQTTLVQPDRSVFSGMKHILEGDDDRITHIMNYTRGSEKASCVVYLLRVK